MPEKRDRQMNAINWAGQIEDIAGPYGGNRKGWLSKAARKSGTTFRQVKALYYGECVNPKTNVALSVLNAAAEAREKARDLATQFETLAGALNAKDADFYSHDVLTLIDAARKIRGVDRA